MSRSRQKINSLIKEYQEVISEVVDGYASIEQQESIQSILNELSFFTTRILIVEAENSIAKLDNVSK